MQHGFYAATFQDWKSHPILKFTHRLIERSTEVEKIADLLSSRREYVCLIPEAAGSVGSGKSTLAWQTAARLLDIEVADWAVWIYCGAQLKTLDDLRATEVADASGNSSRLGDVIDKGQGLIVIDDLWAKTTADALGKLFGQNLILVTTELPTAVSEVGTAFKVTGLQTEDCLQIVSDILDNPTSFRTFSDSLGQIVQFLNGNPFSASVLGYYLQDVGFGERGINSIREAIQSLSRIPNPLRVTVNDAPDSVYSCELSSVGGDSAVRWHNVFLGGEVVSGSATWLRTRTEKILSEPGHVTIIAPRHEPIPPVRGTGYFDEPTRHDVAYPESSVAFQEAAAWANEKAPVLLLPIVADTQDFLVKQAIQSSAKDYILRWNRIAMDLARKADNVLIIATSSEMIAFAEGTGGQPALDRLIEVRDWYTEQGLSGSQALLTIEIAAQLLQQGRTDDAHRAYMDTVQWFGDKGDIPAKATLLLLVADIERRVGLFEDADKNYKEALASFIVTQDLPAVARARLKLGNLDLDRRRYSVAQYHFEEGLRIVDEWLNTNPLDEAEIIGLAERVVSSEALRAISDFMPTVDRVLTWVNMRLIHADLLKHTGDMIHLADAERADGIYRAAIDIYLSLQSLLGAANAYRSLGDLHARNSSDLAEGLYHEAIRLYRQVGSIIGEVSTEVALVKALTATQPKKARELAEQTVKRSQDTGMAELMTQSQQILDGLVA